MNRLGFLVPTSAAIIVCVSALALVLAVTDQAGAVKVNMNTAPGLVATVDMLKLIEKLDEKAQWEIQIDALTRQITDELDQRQTAIKERSEEAMALQDGPAKNALADEIALAGIRLEEWFKLKQLEVDRERSLMWQSIYRNIREQAKQIAKGAGYQAVFVNDSSSKFMISAEGGSQEQQVMAMIRDRQMLYADPTDDITEELIVRLNNMQAAVP